MGYKHKDKNIILFPPGPSLSTSSRFLPEASQPWAMTWSHEQKHPFLPRVPFVGCFIMAKRHDTETARQRSGIFAALRTVWTLLLLSCYPYRWMDSAVETELPAPQSCISPAIVLSWSL